MTKSKFKSLRELLGVKSKQQSLTELITRLSLEERRAEKQINHYKQGLDRAYERFKEARRTAAGERIQMILFYTYQRADMSCTVASNKKSFLKEVREQIEREGDVNAIALFDLPALPIVVYLLDEEKERKAYDALCARVDAELASEKDV